MGGLLRNGGNWIVAGVIAAVLLPALVVAVHIPFLIALGAAALAFGGVGVLLAPRGLFEGIDLSGIGGGRVALARKVLTEAMPDLERLAERAGEIRNAATRGRIDHLAATARAIVDGVEKDPARLMAVQRFLTYYLPQAADVAENYGLLERRRVPDLRRLGEMEAIIGRLDDAFTHYADSLVEADLSGLDTELRLLSASLEADLGKTP